jgi:hypothetical protein
MPMPPMAFIQMAKANQQSLQHSEQAWFMHRLTNNGSPQNHQAKQNWSVPLMLQVKQSVSETTYSLVDIKWTHPSLVKTTSPPNRSSKKVPVSQEESNILTFATNEKQMIVKYVKTNDMIADILTKPIQGEQFNRLRDLLLGTIPEKLYSWISLSLSRGRAPPTFYALMKFLVKLQQSQHSRGPMRECFIQLCVWKWWSMLSGQVKG